MHMQIMRLLFPLVTGVALVAQIPQGMDLQGLKQAAGQAGAASPEITSTKLVATPEAAPTPQETQRQRQEEEKQDEEIRSLKVREKAPRRFAADLFAVRQRGAVATEGGIAEDYVLGTGDRLNLNVFGSATFDLPLQVDGRGEVVIPKVGTAKVGGLSLGKAKGVVQGLVARNFSRSTVDLQVIKLREVRVFVMGEVYKPGGYMVSSLSSLVNVLSLAGGPTAIGSFRDIRLLRGGRMIFSLDLYPLRAEGLGNPNLALQSGDTVFVPLAQNQILLEGAFQRVVAIEADSGTGNEVQETSSDPEKAQVDRWRSEVKTLESGLGKAPEGSLGIGDRASIEDRILFLKSQIAANKESHANDERVDESVPRWLRAWERSGALPVMQFELKVGETALDALRFAGGLAPEAGQGALTLRRRSGGGIIGGQDVTVAMAGQTVLQRGDVLSALVQRERLGAVVKLAGWVRVPGTYARTEGLRVGDLLRRDAQLLPDTYRPRGEVIHTTPDGTTRYQPFDVDKAVAGDPNHNLLLEDRDKVALSRQEAFRLPRTVNVNGPVTHPGMQTFHEGMRASDLLFRAGIPQKNADHLVAELAHSREGSPSEVVRLDLAVLLSTETASPLALLDEKVNPRILPDDQLSIFEKPGFKIHRNVRISGYVLRPGVYTFDSDKPTIRTIFQRAGGLAPEAMLRGGIFLRRVGQSDGTLERAAELSGVTAKDPTAKGITEILERLSEVKRNSTTGLLQKSPVMHGLVNGTMNRMVVNFENALKGDAQADVELLDGDEIVIPRVTEAAYVVGETASPFATYRVDKGMSVKALLKMAGGTTRNADTSNIRLLKADGRIIDSWVEGKPVEPGDTVLVPQRFRRDTSWQENLQALTPLALILNALATSGHL